MEDQADHIVYSKEVIDFVSVANNYCQLAEGAVELNRRQLLTEALGILSNLYYRATNLPDIEPLLEEQAEHLVTEEDWDYIHQTIQRILGRHDAYQEVFDPNIQYSETPVGASLAENFADIYQDIKNFITLYQIGTTEIMHDALWECRQNFEQYWGQKLVNALRPMHQLLFNTPDLDDEEEKIPDNKTTLEDVDTSDWIITRQQQQYKEDENEE